MQARQACTLWCAPQRLHPLLAGDNYCYPCCSTLWASHLFPNFFYFNQQKYQNTMMISGKFWFFGVSRFKIWGTKAFEWNKGLGLKVIRNQAQQWVFTKPWWAAAVSWRGFEGERGPTFKKLRKLPESAGSLWWISVRFCSSNALRLIEELGTCCRFCARRVAL